MKKLLTLLFCIFTSIVLNAQNVNIPDANFKTYLLNRSEININGDNQIQMSEAANYDGDISCSNLGIYDLTGIEAFVNVQLIDCSNNNIQNLDLSQNTALKGLWCKSNRLNALNLNNNTALTALFCGFNSISNLDLSQNLDLVNITCNDNRLTHLIVGNNASLVSITCSGNYLQTLNLSNCPSLNSVIASGNQFTSFNLANGYNAAIISLDLTGNTALNCIKVDNETYSSTNWIGTEYKKPANAFWSVDCDAATSTKDLNLTDFVRLYPNPANEILNIELLKNETIQIFDILGANLKSLPLKKGMNLIDISNFASGMYTLRTQSGGAVNFIKTD